MMKAQILPIEFFILQSLLVPASDAIRVMHSVRRVIDGDAESLLRHPKVKFKRSVLAWTLLITYHDSPAKFILGGVCLCFVLPLLLLSKIF